MDRKKERGGVSEERVEREGERVERRKRERERVKKEEEERKRERRSGLKKKEEAAKEGAPPSTFEAARARAAAAAIDRSIDVDGG